MTKQNEINKMLKDVSCSYSPLALYGKIAKISLCHVLIAVDIIVPSFKLISLFAVKFCKNIELFRITLKN